jgi:hypothetical protein
LRKGEVGLALRIGRDVSTEAVASSSTHMRRCTRSILRRLGRTS